MSDQGEITPEKLAQQAEYADLEGESRFANIMLAAVGPWKAALARLEELDREERVLRGKLLHAESHNCDASNDGPHEAERDWDFISNENKEWWMDAATLAHSLEEAGNVLCEHCGETPCLGEFDSSDTLYGGPT